MNEEEWQFLVVMVGAGVLAAAVAVNDLFSLQKFWARLIRSKRPPTPETITRAYTRHQRFYHHTDRSLFSTTYVSFYLFVLSYIGMLLMAALILIQDTLQGTSYNADTRLASLSAILFFFLISRWYYRQEAHHITAHKLFAILSSFLFIDFVYRITGLEYIQAATILLILWIWMIGVVRAVVGFEVNYVRTITLSLCIPLAVLVFLATSNGIVIFALFVPGIAVTLKEFISKSELEFKKMKRIFPNPLPFIPVQPDSFLKDVMYSSHPEKIFAGCSVWEVLFWFAMTPVVLIPITQYLQGREEQLQQWHDDLIQWSQNEYVLNPETVADRLGKTLEDTYPLLNELTEEGKLTLYESVEGLIYGLPLPGEMDAFAAKLNLRKADLPEKDRDLLEYLWEKGRTRPPTIVLLSVMDNVERIDVSCEPAGGTISPLKTSVSTDAGPLAQVSRDINYYVGEHVKMLSEINRYTLVNPHRFLSNLEKKGNDLLKCAVPHEILKGLEMSHLVLETTMDDIPFELMCSDKFFALKYAMGRRLLVTGPVSVRAQGERGKLRALIIADPQCNLKEALTECDYLERELAHLLEICYLPQKKATWKDVLTCLAEGYSIIHYAGHASENGLHLSDAVLEPSTVETLLWGNPIVFINGCNSAKTHTRLAEAFLRGGALGYIGSIWEIHDVAAAELATDFYTNSFQYSVGEALRMAKATAFYKNNISWLCFILFGDPTLRLI